MAGKSSAKMARRNGRFMKPPWILWPIGSRGRSHQDVEMKVFHAVGRDFGRIDGDALAAKFLVGGINVGARKVNASIVVGGTAGGVGGNGTFVIEFVGGVEHELRVAQFEQAPVESVFAAEGWRGHFDGEAKLVAVEADGS